jgi:hypothetical protein
MSIARTLAAVPLVAGCLGDVPAEPSFQADVLPILAASCVRCHAYPSIGGAPSEFRLDSHDDTVIDEGDPQDPLDDVRLFGVAYLAATIVDRVGKDEMPPTFPLEDVPRETLLAWARSVPLPPDPPAPRQPRPGNVMPVIAVDATGRAGTDVLVRYQLDDADGDLVVGELRLRGAGVDRLVVPIRAGRDEVRWAPGTTAPGSYALVARVDDGGGWLEVPAGSLVLEAP